MIVGSQGIDDDDEDDLVGTRDYISPEALKKQKASFASDLWSLGIIVW
jgi:serine/threonine protein kinase